VPKIVHGLFNILLPILVYVFIRTDFFQLAIAVVLLAKWRIFSVKARHWPANIRANAVDIFVGLSFVIFMQNSMTLAAQVVWGVLYGVWLLLIKPQSTDLWIGMQAMISQTLSFVAIFIIWPRASAEWLCIAVGFVAYFSARHFFAIFDEAMSRATAYTWAFMASSLTWAASHWLLYYGPVSQPALLLSILGYGLTSLYYLRHTDRLSKVLQRQILLMMIAITFFILLTSDWSDKVI
jgi:hypothetical protein